MGGYLPIGYLPIRVLSWADIGVGSSQALRVPLRRWSGRGATHPAWEPGRFGNARDVCVAASVDERCSCALRMRNARTARALWEHDRCYRLALVDTSCCLDAAALRGHGALGATRLSVRSWLELDGGREQCRLGCKVGWGVRGEALCDCGVSWGEAPCGGLWSGSGSGQASTSELCGA